MFCKRRTYRGERGQLFMVFALLIPILGGMAGMAVDLGGWASDRRALQNAADSMALAAAQELPDAAKAQTIGATWATKNGIDPTQFTISVTGGDVSPKVTVTVNRSHNFAFLRMLGVNSGNVGARAAAVKVSVGGNSGVVPWAVTSDTVNVALGGNNVSPVITLKYDATGANTGNFGAIRIDGSGASTYEADAKYGSNSYVCAVTAPSCVAGACPGHYPDICAETAPQCDGPICNPETGNMTNPTQRAVDFRMNNTISSCNEFGEAFPTTDPDTGVYQLSQACNPWVNGAGYCATATSPCSRRVIIIPIVDDFGNGQSTVTFQRFALVWLEGYTGNCTGNDCEILGRFVRADVTMNALAGTYDPGAQIHFVKLSE